MDKVEVGKDGGWRVGVGGGGWGRGTWWWENGDNCIGTTIKKI